LSFFPKQLVFQDVKRVSRPCSKDAACTRNYFTRRLTLLICRFNSQNRQLLQSPNPGIVIGESGRIPRLQSSKLVNHWPTRVHLEKEKWWRWRYAVL